jgi:hypothetical protein
MCGGNAPPHRLQTRSACGGKDEGDPTPEVELVFGPIFSPHRPQYLEFSGSGAEQRGHGNMFVSSPALTRTNDLPPQRPQNFTPSANLE